MFSRWKGDGDSCSQRMPSPNDSPFSYVVGSKQTMHSISTPKVRFSGFGMLADWLLDARWDLENAKREGREDWAPFPALATLLYFGNDLVCFGRTKVCTWHHQRQRPWAQTGLTWHHFDACKRQRMGARFRPRMPLITGVVFYGIMNKTKTI